MIKTTISAGWVVVVLSLAGCAASYPEYKSADTAAVTFKSAVMGTSVWVPKGRKCFEANGSQHYGNWSGTSDAWSVGFIGSSDVAKPHERTAFDKALGMQYERTVNVPANLEFAFYVDGITEFGYASNRYCGLMPAFTPRAGDEYEVRFRSRGRHCSVEVFEIDKGTRGLFKVDVHYYPRCGS